MRRYNWNRAASTLCLLVSIGLSGCSRDNEAPDTDSPAAGEAAAAPLELPGERDTSLSPAYDHITSWTGDLDGMAERRVIRILTVYSVGRYYLDGANERGLVRESATRFEDFINKRLGRRTTRVHTAVVPVARDQLIPALLQGRGDIIVASLSVTPERENVLEFSAPASKPLSEILVTGPAAPPLQGIEDLAGQTVYLRESSSYRESVETLNERFSAEGLELVRIEPVSELLEDADIVEMVNAGMLPWAIVDDYKLGWWEGVFDDLVARPDIVFRAGGRMAWAMRKESPKLKAAINDFLKTHREGTLIGNVLKNRYVRDFDWAANALSEEAYNRFAELEDVFRKYGDRYEFEYLLLAAQGYQESRLDQSARSSSGAVGIMQIKPSTARDPNVGIHDVHEVDANIHAGTRYMHFLRDRYFSHEGMDETNSWLMSLAAYNVGPARMIKLREQAAKLGYNPDEWFDNVEIAAAKYVGREPVQYVANVYKYSLAYLLSEEQVRQRSQARQRAGMEPLAPKEG